VYNSHVRVIKDRGLYIATSLIMLQNSDGTEAIPLPGLYHELLLLTKIK